MAGSFQAPAAQVYLRDAELTFNAEHADVLHYEHALHLLMAVRRQSISIYSVPSSDQAPQVSRQEVPHMILCMHITCTADLAESCSLTPPLAWAADS